MKKLIILCLSIMLSVQVVAQVKQDSTKLTVKEVYNDAKQVIAQLAKALQIGTEHVYEVVVKQQLVHSITWLIIYLVGFTSIYLSLKKTFNLVQEDDDWINLLIPLCVVALVFMVTFVWTIDDVVTGFVNPEYGALRTIMNLIKSK